MGVWLGDSEDVVIPRELVVAACALDCRPEHLASSPVWQCGSDAILADTEDMPKKTKPKPRPKPKGGY